MITTFLTAARGLRAVALAVRGLGFITGGGGVGTNFLVKLNRATVEKSDFLDLEPLFCRWS